VRHTCWFSRCAQEPAAKILYLQILFLGFILFISLYYITRRDNSVSYKPKKEKTKKLLEQVNRKKMSVVGIDFGNLNTVVAVARNRGIDVIVNEVSNRATP
jgi:hypothetical protein